jgi:hypothetical protein
MRCEACRALQPPARYCARCGWNQEIPTGQRAHIFHCATEGCQGHTGFSESWLPELATTGHAWVCSECGARQLARVALPVSAYSGYRDAVLYKISGEELA